MATLEDLRQKKRIALQGQLSSNSLADAREKRRQEIQSDKFSFTETPKIPTSTIEPEPTSTAGDAFKRSAGVNTLPLIGGLATGIKGARLGSVFGPVGTVVGLIGGTIAGSIITKKTQDKVLEVTKGEEWKRNLDQSIAEDRKTHPYATLLGETAPALIAFRPSPTTLKQALNLSKRALTDKSSLATHLKTLQGKTELDALVNVGIGAGVDVSLETYQQIREGNGATIEGALRILGSAVLGGTISNPNRIGVKMGFKPSGDAIIEEYDKYGSKTEAARIITHGDIPVIDRSTDRLLLERKELSAILRGEAEKNRFTEPRILQAERIAGTIDKDVTPDSDLNIYRLDGRSGAMRVGERVTANPHIADVFGGRINPEATVKAGDLVRTSKGDYIYAPKEAIVSRPKLPPVTTAVDKTIREQVTNREKLQVKELKAKGKEAIRIAEEPARLKKEAEELALKEQEEAEKAVIKRQKDAEESFIRDKRQADEAFAREEKNVKIAKIRLTNEIKKTEANRIKALAEEKSRIKAEKKAVDNAKDKQIEDIAVKLRKELNEAMLDHVKRLKNLKTKNQKVKENIRYNNLKAVLTAKARKVKKQLSIKAKETKENIKGSVDKIKTETDTTINSLKEKAKSIPKPKLAKVESVARRIKAAALVNETKPLIKKSKAVVAKENDTPTVVIKEDVPSVKETSKPERTTTIGSKVVKSESIIKNAVQEARETSQKAQEIDQDITYQMGTTFVEQRKLTAELIVEKGFEDALVFAREASGAELNKMGIDRSALYEGLYKMAIREDQFGKYRDQLEELGLLAAAEVSPAAQKSSLHRLATANDPFRRIVKLQNNLIQKEKKIRGSAFTKEVDELYAKLKESESDEDLNKIIKENLC